MDNNGIDFNGIINSNEFKDLLEKEIVRINKQRSGTLSKLKKDGAGDHIRFKRGPIDTLIEFGRWSANGIIGVLPEILKKESCLPASVRNFISDLSIPVFVKVANSKQKTDEPIRDTGKDDN